ncbi:hypothetical protein [Serinicoccus sp. CUA-874]|uniref:hypothetical protein n=1 Tax=Serinicoccus sp. CUA-874 TaxID=1517939 RepID=UPI00192CE971|nr:hypothetical protein [Serinicoccus sp. CUA-874]
MSPIQKGGEACTASIPGPTSRSRTDPGCVPAQPPSATPTGIETTSEAATRPSVHGSRCPTTVLTGARWLLE